MSHSTYTFNAKPLIPPALRQYQSVPAVVKRLFAFGYYFEERSKKTFRDVAEEFAPHLQEIYFPWPGLLTAREIDGDPEPLRKRLVDDLLFCKRQGMKLDLLVNATCYGEDAFTTTQRDHFRACLKEMADCGVAPDVVTTTSPYIALLAKKFNSAIDRRASVNSRLNSTLAIEYVKDQYDSFYICRDIQRDLPTMRIFSKWCRDNGKRLCMLANSGCLRYCPWQTFHESLLSHNYTHVWKEAKAVKLQPTLCVNMLQEKKFEEILRCSWIRPEDLHFYEPFVSVIKLSTREASDPELILKAYTEGKFNGDLLRILDPGFAYFFRPFILDNTAFPKEWSEGKIAGLCANDCTHCGKCSDVMKQVYKRDPNLPDLSQYSFQPVPPKRK